MAETIPQFYKRIQRCDPKLDATYSKGKEYFNIFSRQCYSVLCNSAIGISIK